MNDPLVYSVLAVIVSVVTLGVTLLRRQSQLARDLYAENDLKDQRIARLEGELAEALKDLHDARVKMNTGTVLKDICVMAAKHAEQMGGTELEKFRHALSAARRLDEGDNGKRDYTDAQLTFGIEAAVHDL
jgi:hypothetical protein